MKRKSRNSLIVPRRRGSCSSFRRKYGSPKVGNPRNIPGVYYHMYTRTYGDMFLAYSWYFPGVPAFLSRPPLSNRRLGGQMRVSIGRGPQRRPPYTRILTVGTPRKGSPNCWKRPNGSRLWDTGTEPSRNGSSNRSTNQDTYSNYMEVWVW